jgi:hypothetical protein
MRGYHSAAAPHKLALGPHMQTIIEWFNNTWVVGILGGVLSGLIVNYVSRLFLSKKENREYLQKIFSANREVIYSIRPGISEGVIPKPETVEALIVATARKYSVNREDVYGPSEITQELTKEVMDSSFISSQLKQEYCDRLLSIIPAKVTAEVGEQKSSAPIEVRIVSQQRRERTVERMSMVMGLFTGLMSVVFAMFTITKDTGALSRLSDSFERTGVFLPLLVAMVTLAMSVAVLPIMKELLVVKRKLRGKEDSEPNSQPEDLTLCSSGPPSADAELKR